MHVRVVAVIVLCAALPVLIGVLLAGPVSGGRLVGQAGGHWVYVPDRGVVAHVDGVTKRVDATVLVGSFGAGSSVAQDRRAAYLVGNGRVVMFGRGGVVREVPSARVAERPVAVEARGAAYLVYRNAGVVVRLGSAPVAVGGPVGVPVVTPDGRLWMYQVDSGRVCVLAGKLSCMPGHPGVLALLDGSPGFVDVIAGTWQAIGGRPVSLGVSLPPSAVVGTSSVGGRLPIVDPGGRLLLVKPGGDVIAVPLGDGRSLAPVSTGRFVAVVQGGTVASYDARGRRKASVTVPDGVLRLVLGGDGRAYADSVDGRQSVVMDGDGALTSVPTTDASAPSYQPPTPTPSVSLPPATVAATTTETVPPVPDTVTVEVPPTSGAPPTPAAPPTTAADTAPPVAGPPPPVERPSVDVLSVEATGSAQATLRIRVSGSDPVFCHVYFNSVERAATRCDGTMTVVANGLSTGTTYDVYVLGTNAAGTGVPGRRAVLRM